MPAGIKGKIGAFPDVGSSAGAREEGLVLLTATDHNQPRSLSLRVRVTQLHLPEGGGRSGAPKFCSEVGHNLGHTPARNFACGLHHYKLGLTASQVVRLIGLLLVFASQKIVHDVQNEMAEKLCLRP